MITIVDVKDAGHLEEKAIDYFSSAFGIDRKIYLDAIGNSPIRKEEIPRWFLALDGDEIIGCIGLIMNDFISRQDLYPWICALFVEEEHRGQGIAARLLDAAENAAINAGYENVYLATDHESYYEKYSYEFIGMAYQANGEESRVYKKSID